jgi:hypothetical protein
VTSERLAELDSAAVERLLTPDEWDEIVVAIRRLRAWQADAVVALRHAETALLEEGFREGDPTLVGVSRILATVPGKE